MAHLIHGGSCQFAHLDRDAVESMLGMAAPVSIDAMTHMQQFFADDNLQRLGLREIDTPQIDQDQVFLPRPGW